jgi:hypothetical protein
VKRLEPFASFVERGVVRVRSPDPNRSRDLARESTRKRASLDEQKRIIGIKDSNANDYIESCYDIILFTIRSALFANGYSTSGGGAHEAEVAYARELGIGEDDVRFLDALRAYRNRMLYAGTRFDAHYARAVYAFMERVLLVLEE